MNFEDLLRLGLAPQAGENRKGMKERGYVEVLSAPKSHRDHVLVRPERLLQLLRLRCRVWSMLGFAEVDRAKVEPSGRVRRIRFCNTLERCFGIGIAQL